MGVGCQIGFCAFVVLCCGCRVPPPCGGALEFNGWPPLFLLFCDQKRSRKVPLLPRRGARLKGNGSDCCAARAALRAVSLKNPRADGLAPARGQHSTVGWFVISNLCCLFPFGCWGRRPRRPGDCAGLRFWVLDGIYAWSVGRGLDPSLRLGGCAWLHGRIWNPPLR